MVADVTFTGVGGQEQTSRHPVGEEWQSGPSPALPLTGTQVEQHTLKQEALNKQALIQEALNKQALKQEALNRQALKQEALKQEALN